MNEAATPESAAHRNLFTLWLILAVCLLPVVASTALFYLAPPAERMNYGDLISPPIPLPDLILPGVNGTPIPLAQLRGKWTMVHIDGADCGLACKAKLYKMRQVRLTQGKNMDRVQRVWVITDDAPVSEGLSREYAGTIMVRVNQRDVLLRAFPATASVEEHIWMVDPLGNVMLRFPSDADPSRMKADLTRLLRVSRIE